MSIRSPQKEVILSFLEKSELFSCLDNSNLTRLRDHCRFEQVAKREVLFNEGDTPLGGYIVAQGRLILSKKAANRVPIVVEILGPGDPFGIVCTATVEQYPLTAEAVRESVVVKIDQQALTSLTLVSGEFERSLFNLCRSRFKSAQSRFAAISGLDSKVRVANALLLYAHKFSFDSSGIIDLTRHELARVAGTAIETCIRTTSSFQDQGIVDFPANGQIRILDLAKLQGIVKF